MATLILNRDTFSMPADGWYQIAPLGEFSHAQAGVVQVVDVDACAAMVNRFRAEAKGANFAGLLVDFDHFSLDGEKRSEAAGWITDLDNRDGGLFAKIRWSDVGEDAVKGGRYRFLSPVWARSDCVDLGNGRVRPVRLLNAAVTNDPNLKGMRPLSNSSTPLSAGSAATAGGVQRFVWKLGTSPEGHCPSCASLAGQVRTMAEWQDIGAVPGTGGLYCQGKCHCSLVPTDEEATGDIAGVPVRRGGWKLAMNDERGTLSDEQGLAEEESVIRFLANTGWTDAARAASLAVRRQKAAARGASAEGGEEDGSGGEDAAADDDAAPSEDSATGEDGEAVDYAEWFHEEGLGAMSAEDIATFTEQLRQKLAAGEELDYVEEGFLEERVDGGYAGESDADPVYEWAEKKADRESQVFEATGMDARDARGKATDLEFRKQQGEKLSAEDESFLKTYNGIMSAGDVMANAWSDAARAAALAVRRAKAAARGLTGYPDGYTPPVITDYVWGTEGDNLPTEGYVDANGIFHVFPLPQLPVPPKKPTPPVFPPHRGPGKPPYPTATKKSASKKRLLRVGGGSGRRRNFAVRR